jgi:hypothetical protein
MGIRRLDSSEVERVILDLLPHFEEEVGYYKKPNGSHLVAAWKRVMDAGIGVAYAAAKDGGPVGVFLGMIVPELFTGELQALEVLWYVRKDYRKLFSKQMLFEFEVAAKLRGCTSILSGATASFKPEVMARFYKARGYEFHGNAFRKAL